MKTKHYAMLALGALGAFLMVTVSYLLWKSKLGTQVAPIANDVIRDAIYASVCLFIGAGLTMKLVGRRPATLFALIGLCSGAIVYGLYSSGVACEMKKLDVCEPLWSNGTDGSRVSNT